MDYRPLGRSGIEVSAICLGTMTWGTQNTEQEGFAQMDLARERGVTFFDAAEMYPVPPSAETYGRTEEIVGNWLQSRACRDEIVVATKVTGPGSRFPYIRDGACRLDRKNIEAAIDTSLQRLKTDYVDLYQLHWPDRSTNIFGQLGYHPDPDDQSVPLAETLAVLDDLVKAGKVRTVGLSNETPWGTMSFLKLAELGKGPRMVSVQNPYSLLNRSFEVGQAEVAIREDCRLLAYAPIAAGVLSGKYLDGAQPAGARLTLYPQNSRYRTATSEPAVRKYVDLARRHDLRPEVMANAFVVSRPFATASIVGATSLEQLEIQLSAAEVQLSQEVLEGIEAIHAEHTIPCP
ncbi:NADP(H)-dependent aldo-keto reductase [Algihabitans albus]|uniref:NADP(H)-dependent aldo-keto reductase n=1 Tax=Algihabitans albus TaxID=2164067 RepID=UPI000E5C8A16|nr:NADP(H)-dependent aldo-keto reductase [Algihabitans albus]